MRIEISARDAFLARFGNQIAALGTDQAAIVMSRALNHVGDKGRTQVKRALVKQTGIRYGRINSAVATIRSNRMTLAYELRAKGEEANIALFGARQGKRGVSAAPWGKRRVFKSTFMVGRYGGNVFRRRGPQRLPLRAVYGPNIARELLKDEAVAAFAAMLPAIADRVGHELGRVLRG